jgi:hypothetical protein
VLRKKGIRASRRFLKPVLMVESTENGSTSNSVACRDPVSLIVIQHGCARRRRYSRTQTLCGRPELKCAIHLEQTSYAAH